MKTREPTTQPTSAMPPQVTFTCGENTKVNGLLDGSNKVEEKEEEQFTGILCEYTHIRDHPSIYMSAKFLNFWIPSPLSAFGTDLQHIIHATYLASSSFWWPLPLQVRISYVDGPLGKSNDVVHNIVICFPYSQVYEAIALLFSL